MKYRAVRCFIVRLCAVKFRRNYRICVCAIILYIELRYEIYFVKCIFSLTFISSLRRNPHNRDVSTYSVPSPLFHFLLRLFFFGFAWKMTGRMSMEKRGMSWVRETPLIEDSSSNFAGLCARKRRLLPGEASTWSFLFGKRGDLWSWLLFHVAAGFV